MFKLGFYVPVTHAEAVKKAVFDTGAGRIGDYSDCSWQTLGVGQFRPLSDSNPYIGKIGDVETVAEYRIELVCRDELIKSAVKALIDAHPYEEPAYDIVKLEQIELS